jgi:hypothetical protein
LGGGEFIAPSYRFAINSIKQLPCPIREPQPDTVSSSLPRRQDEHLDQGSKRGGLAPVCAGCGSGPTVRPRIPCELLGTCGVEYRSFRRRTYHCSPSNWLSTSPADSSCPPGPSDSPALGLTFALGLSCAVRPGAFGRGGCPGLCRVEARRVAHLDPCPDPSSDSPPTPPAQIFLEEIATAHVLPPVGPARWSEAPLRGRVR